MNSLQHSTGSRHRRRITAHIRPLGRALVAAGLLSVGSAWTQTWTINFDPTGTVMTPPANSGLRLQVSCADASINAGSNVFPDSGDPSRADIRLENNSTGPSNIAVSLTPTTPGTDPV